MPVTASSFAWCAVRSASASISAWMSFSISEDLAAQVLDRAVDRSAQGQGRDRGVLTLGLVGDGLLDELASAGGQFPGASVQFR